MLDSVRPSAPSLDPRGFRLRKKMYRILSLLFIAHLLLVSIAIGQSGVRDPAEENPIIEELRKAAGQEAVDRFVAATEALDNNQFEEARPLYEEVLKKAPDFEPALRRLGYTY